MFVISGVTGHVGSVAAQELIDHKKAVKVIVRDAVKGAVWAQKGAQAAVGSLEDAAFLGAALKGAESFAEMYDGFAKGRIKPCGDRLVQGKTELAEVIAALTGAAARA